ncbi:MAG: ATP-binding protein, partial [Maribacter sp.]|uniref:ATP-binding protein n=1 Tax=Maribacter sp. TaxID=1897614 RepID=UPI003C70B255
IQTEQFSNYSVADGIQGQLFADGQYLKTSDGHFIFGGSNGLTIFRPEDVNKNSTPPKVFLTDLKLFNKSVVPGEHSLLKRPIYDTEEIILAHNQNNIAIGFSALHYANPSKNKYLYTLENYDNEWREGTSRQDAFYPNLEPGRYVFRVKAANNNGVWNEKGAVLHIIVTPPWWYTSWSYAAYALLFMCGVYGANRFFRNRVIVNERKKTQARELAQAKEIEKAYHKLEESHETLKATQSQLIQSEKMASLGELTAGIAHEIQNPLNFVNNFSEVSNELIDEMNEEIENGDLDEAKAIANDIKQNLEKINHHGKRADAIVKGMLQHSRSSSGVKEPTDINALADEYLRLAYHGLRAKDKSFNATMNTDFDESIGKINVVPQDIGRVVLNLITNAFYAVNEKKQKDNNFKPMVAVSTKKIGNQIRISVSDNGDGIPDKVKEKIFQPFFTTKPTGQGTGLGLSMSYDIITKGHGGELKVETKEGEGTTFIIQFPTT